MAQERDARDDGLLAEHTVQAILDARTAQLARRGDGGAAPQDSSDALLVCAVGAELYALFVDQVSAVVTWRAPSPVPGSLPGVLGLIADKAVTYNLADMGVLLGMPAPDRRQDGMLLLLRHQRPRIALAVDRVERVTSTYQPATEGDRPAAAPDAMTAFMRDEAGNGAEPGRGFALLDMNLLLKPLLETTTKPGAH